MIKFKARDAKGKDLVGLGLSFANLKKFMDQPMDTYIIVKGSDLDIPFDIMIFSGKTEEDIANSFRKSGVTWAEGTEQ